MLGIDANESRVVGAQDLIEMVGLGCRVRFLVGGAAALGLPAAGMNRVVRQDAVLHDPDRAGPLAGCARVLKPGGGLGFTDRTATDRLDAVARRTLVEAMAALGMASAEDTVAHLRAAGFTTIEVEDLSAEWRVVLRGRLEMFPATVAGTVARFSRERHATHIGNYELLVDRIDAGEPGGGRFIAWKDQAARPPRDAIGERGRTRLRSRGPRTSS